MQSLDSNLAGLLVWLLAACHVNEVDRAGGLHRLRYLTLIVELLSIVLRSSHCIVAVGSVVHARGAREVVVMYDLVRESILLPPSLLH